MHTTAIRALAGEIFGKSKSSILGAAVIIPAAWLVATAYMRNAPGMGPNIGTPVGFVLLVSVAIQLGAAFSYVDLTAGGKSTGFPKHILLLPAPTWLLALVPIITGSFFIAGFVLLWLRFLSGVKFDWAQQLTLATAITSVMCWIQAISWDLLPRSLRIVTLLVVVITTILSAISALATEQDFLLGRSGGAIALALTTAGGYGLAYLAVIRARCSETSDLNARLKRLFLSRVQPLREAPLPTLSNAVAAQNWFEWRVYGRLLPSFMIVIGAFPLASVAFDRTRHAPSIALSTFLLAVFYVLVSPMMGAAYISKDMTRRVQMGTFAATRPLSDLQLAFAKLRLAVKSYALSQAIVFAVIGVIIVASRNNAAVLALWSRLTAQLGTRGSCLGLLLLLGEISAASWAASALFMSLQLFYEAVDRKKHGWKISIGAVTLFLLLLILARRAYEARDSALAWLQSARAGVMIPAVLLMGIALWLLPQFRRVASPSALATVAVGFLVVTGLGLTLLSQLHLPFGYRWALSWGLVSLALLTFMPFVLVPILVGMSRHR
jgi:hypothetical protein